MSIVPSLLTDRLFLREWRDSDVMAYAAMQADPEVRRYLGNGLPMSESEAAADIAAYRDQWSRAGYGRWAVEDRSTASLIGYCGLLLWHGGQPDESGELGYGYAREAWGRGIATEAGAVVVSWAFSHMPGERIVGLTHPGNLASQRVLTKLGFEPAGEAMGRFYPMLLFEFPRTTFEAMRAASR